MSLGVDVQRWVPVWESLQSVVPIRHIDSEVEYEQAIELLNSLLDVVRDNASHPLYSLVSVVGDLIEAYELDQEPRIEALND